MYEIYSTQWCSYCTKAKDLLTKHNLEYIEHDIDLDDKAMEFIVENGFKTIPVIYKDGILVGGFEDLTTMVGEG